VLLGGPLFSIPLKHLSCGPGSSVFPPSRRSGSAEVSGHLEEVHLGDFLERVVVTLGTGDFCASEDREVIGKIAQWHPLIGQEVTGGWVVPNKIPSRLAFLLPIRSKDDLRGLDP